MFDKLRIAPIAVMVLMSTACGSSYPLVGGVGPMPNYRFAHERTEVFSAKDGVQLIVRAGGHINGAGDYEIGAIQILDLHNTNASSKCAEIHFSSVDNNAYAYGGGETWLIKKGQTLGNIGQINQVQAYSKQSGSIGVQLDSFYVWDPNASGRC